MTERTRKMLMTIRAALIMAAKAIEEYCKGGTGEVVSIWGEGVTVMKAEYKDGKWERVDDE